ncbi:MAG TPA: hypothetical protein DDY14_08285, partial [Chromatiaceae bacterium]|nr:hypothetical protein [Chromatiaceae bacterium]
SLKAAPDAILSNACLTLTMRYSRALCSTCAFDVLCTQGMRPLFSMISLIIHRTCAGAISAPLWFGTNLSNKRE